MGQSNAAVKVETLEHKIARLEQENVELNKQKASAGGPSPDVIAVKVGEFATMHAAPRTFSSGSRGFYDNGKVSIAGKRYTMSVILVEIGSKPTA